MAVAFIGGSGYSRVIAGEFTPQILLTPYGEAMVFVGRREGAEVAFLPRHGVGHTIPPHRINYRANIKALQMLGVTRALAVFTVGSLHRGIPPLSLMAVDQFMDFTQGRAHTFFEGGKSGVVHVEVNEPYCPGLRAALIQEGKARGLEIMSRGVYVCTNGPRFETPAEVRMYAQLGGDVVGMTGVPEVSLAREAGIHYAAVALSVNWGAGLEEKIILAEAGLAEIQQKLIDVILDALAAPLKEKCECESSAFVSHPPEEEEYRA